MEAGVCVCVWDSWWVCGSVEKDQGELASIRQASQQECVLLITKGLPQPLGAVSSMRKRNEPVRNTFPPLPTVRASCASLCTWLRFFFLDKPLFCLLVCLMHRTEL